ncbi:MAG TPA: hypothetical protein VKS79_17215 [Gemmataceae bacterium]|nr:hypothetical protein [Gemmataceae bacterium]
MICVRRFLLAAVLATLTTSDGLAGDAEKCSVYSSGNVVQFFNIELRAELKVTPDQERSLSGSEDRRNAISRQYYQDRDKIWNSKLSEREKNPKLRALDVRYVEDLFRIYSETLWPAQMKRMKQILLQMRGIDIFDYPEIRSALKIGDKEAKELHAAWDKWAAERMVQLRADVDAKKITNQEAARLAGSAARSVPRKVRELLSSEQQKILEDLLGEKFVYKK